MLLSYKEFKLLEHAKGAQNVAKNPVFYDEDDLKFLQQFPTTDEHKTNIWHLAFMWRHGEGLLKVAEFWENKGGNPLNLDIDMSDYPERETINLLIKSLSGEVSKIYRFENIKTDIVELWEKLQKEDGADLDLTMARRSFEKARDPKHTFGAGTGAATYETTLRNLNTWIGSSASDWQKNHETWEGKKTEFKPVKFGRQELNVPTISRGVSGYKVINLKKIKKSEEDNRPAKINDLYQVKIYEIDKFLDTEEKKYYFSDFCMVESDGNLNLGSCGKFNVLGLTSSQIKNDIEKYYESVEITKIPEETIINKEPSVQDIPVLKRGGGMTDAKSIFTNKFNVVTDLLKLSKLSPARASQLPLIDPTASPQRTAENLKQIFNQNKDKIGLSNAWLLALIALFDTAEKNWTNPSKQLNLLNLKYALDPNYARNAWDDKPAQMSGKGPSAESDRNNLFNNWDLISDEDKQKLKYIVPEELYGMIKQGNKLDVHQIGAHMYTKGQIGRSGFQQYRNKFDKSQREKIEYFIRKRTERIIENSLGKSFGNGTPLTKEDIDKIQNSDMDIASYVILLPKIVSSTDTAEDIVNDILNCESADATPKQTEYRKAITNRIYGLMSTVLQKINREGIRKSLNTQVGKEGGLELGDTIGDKGEKDFNRKKITTTEEQDFKRRVSECKYAIKRKLKEVEDIWNNLKDSHGDTAASRKILHDKLKSELGIPLQLGDRVFIHSHDLPSVIDEIKNKNTTNLQTPLSAVSFKETKDLTNYIPNDNVKGPSSGKSGRFDLSNLFEYLELDLPSGNTKVIKNDLEEILHNSKIQNKNNFVITYLINIRDEVCQNQLGIKKEYMEEYWGRIVDKVESLWKSMQVTSPTTSTLTQVKPTEQPPTEELQGLQKFINLSTNDAYLKRVVIDAGKTNDTVRKLQEKATKFPQFATQISQIIHKIMELSGVKSESAGIGLPIGSNPSKSIIKNIQRQANIQGSHGGCGTSSVGKMKSFKEYMKGRKYVI